MRKSQRKRLAEAEDSLEALRTQVNALDRYCEALESRLERLESERTRKREEGISIHQVMNEWINGKDPSDGGDA